MSVAGTSQSPEREFEEWRRQQERRRIDPYGFLAITGLYWLTGSAQQIEGLSGRWWFDHRGVMVSMSEPECPSGSAFTPGETSLGTIAEDGSLMIRCGEAVAEVARRGGRHLVRPRRRDSQSFVRFVGTPTYPFDPRWLLPGHYEAQQPSRSVELESVRPGLRLPFEEVGSVLFEHPVGQARLTVFRGKREGTVWFPFSDLTSKDVTAGNRLLEVDVGPGAQSRSVQIDFNRAINFESAYTEFATCPVPPDTHRLDVAVEAGEKLPRWKED